MDPATMMMLTTLASSAISGLFGKGEKHGSTYSKKTRNLIDQIQNMVSGQAGNQDITQNQNYQAGSQWLQDLYNDPNFFQKFEAPLQRQFQEQTVPDLANRFASMGSGGALGSTGFRNQLAREGSNLSTNIAALRGGMQQQGVPQSLAYAQQPFSNWLNMLQSVLLPTKNTYQGPTAGPLAPVASAFAGGAAQAFGQNMGMNAANRFAGQNPSTAPMWDQQFRQTGVY